MNMQSGCSPAAAEAGRERGARAGSKLAPRRRRRGAGDANRTPPAVAGSPQNGSKTGLPWSAARAPSSVPDPVPTRQKLKSVEPGNCPCGVGGLPAPETRVSRRERKPGGSRGTIEDAGRARGTAEAAGPWWRTPSPRRSGPGPAEGSPAGAPRLLAAHTRTTHRTPAGPSRRAAGAPGKRSGAARPPASRPHPARSAGEPPSGRHSLT